MVRQLRKRPDKYASFVPGDFAQYCDSMSRSSTWGDHITLQAAADYYGLKIAIVTSYVSNVVLEILPEVQRSERVIWLAFWAEVHYTSLYPGSEPPREGHDKFLGSKRLARYLQDHKLWHP